MLVAFGTFLVCQPCRWCCPRSTGLLDPFVARLDDLLAELAAVVADDAPVADADRIDRLDRLERARSAVASVQVAETVRFARSQAKEQLAAGAHPKKLGQGIADQIALACRLSPWEGSRRLNIAKALWFDLPQTYALLTSGELRERAAEHVVTETRHLDAEQRRTVDAKVATAKIARMGLRSAAASAPSTRTRRTRRASSNGAEPSGSTVGCRSGRRRTRWLG